MNDAVGILGVGLYLPPIVRRNDYWPDAVTRGWMEARPRQPPPAADSLTEGMRRVLAAQAQQARDPYQGTVERRILPDPMTLLDMEEQASRIAIEKSGIELGDIDLVLTNTTVPDVLLSNPACALHERLGLQKACASMHTDVATHAFMHQLTLAEGMIASGRATAALLVQSCAPSRLVDDASPISPMFGDAATAVVVGRVTKPRGIEASVMFTDGRFPTTLIASVPGRRWFDPGQAQLHIGDPAQMQAVFMHTADVCKESVDAALAKAKRTRSEVAFFCIHQGTPWLRRVVQEHAGLEHARSLDLFEQTGYLFASTIPATLATAAKRGVIAEGDVVVLVGGGPGMTYGATVMTWGRG